MSLQRGLVFENKYIIREQLGGGSFGAVWLAFDDFLKLLVAIKEMIPRPAERTDWEAFFKQEARIGVRLSHPHIVKVYNAFPKDGSYYIIMEYLPGGSLAVWLRDSTRWSLDEAVRLAIECCDGLAYAHDQGIVHCDVKPTNILLDAEGHVKVVDFGLAYVATKIGSSSWQPSSSIAAGTLYYMSPEQLRGDRKDVRNDVYGLGALLYLLLAGRPYLDFIRESTPDADAENVRMIKNLPPLPLEKTSDGRPIPDALRQVVMRALSKTAADRFYTAGAMRDALRAYANDGGPFSPRNDRDQPKPDPLPDPNTRIIPANEDKTGDGQKTRILSDSDRTATRLWRRPAPRVGMGLLVAAAFIAVLIARALEPVALTWLFGLGIGPVWLALAFAGGAMMVLPLWLGDSHRPARSRWSLTGWLALLDVLAIVAAIRLVQDAALARGAEAGALTGGEWLFLLFPFATLAGLLVWVLLAASGAGRGWPATRRAALWTIAAGGLSACFGAILSALFPGELIWLAAPLQMLVFIVSVGLLLQLSLDRWFVLAALTLIGALVLPLLALLAGAEGETLALYGWLGAVPAALGYAAGVGVASMGRTTFVQGR